MVKARGPSKGANWLAKERGLVRPRFTTSCAKLFAEKGDPWLTHRDQDGDYPLNHSREGDKPLTADQLRRAEIYEKARAGLEKAGVSVPPAHKQLVRPSLIIDPDLDRYTKATPVEVKEKYVDPKGKTVTRDHARWRANLLRKTRLAMAAVSVDVKEKARKTPRIKGGFYVFNPPDNDRRK